MKTILLLCLSVLFYGCDERKESSTKSSSSVATCTVNGSPVNCTTKVGNTPGLRAQVTVRISQTGNLLEVLENNQDHKQENGMSCEIQAYSGQIFKLSSDGNSMETTVDGTKTIYFRQNDQNEVRWINFKKDDVTKTHLLETVLRRDNKLVLTLDCIYESNF